MHPKPTAVHVREKQHRLLLPYFIFSYYIILVLPTEVLCATSERCRKPMDLSHYEDLHMDVKGEYLGTSGNPISTALEQV